MMGDSFFRISSHENFCRVEDDYFCDFGYEKCNRFNSSTAIAHHTDKFLFLRALAGTYFLALSAKSKKIMQNATETPALYLMLYRLVNK